MRSVSVHSVVLGTHTQVCARLWPTVASRWSFNFERYRWYRAEEGFWAGWKVSKVCSVLEGFCPSYWGSIHHNSRTRFMVETLINLKNNKVKRNVTQDQGSEAVERMKKFLANLSKRKHGKWFSPPLFHQQLKNAQSISSRCPSSFPWWSGLSRE